MIIEDLASFAGGHHCETTTLGALLRHEGLALSEPLLFGLGEGLGFICWDAKSLDFPLLGGRTKPLMITRTLASNLGLTLTVAETTSRRKAWTTVATALDAGHPVGLQVDSYHLGHITPKVHFGGHLVALYGYDDTDAYLVDTAGPVTAPRTDLDRARSARGPMTARNLSFTIAAPPTAPDLNTALRQAIRGNAHDFLHPPIANLGHRGIAKASQQVLTWLDRSRDFRPTATLMEHGGTGGALFRNLYRDFLAESATIVDDDALHRGHALYTEIAPLWTEVAGHLASAAETGDPRHLHDASELLAALATKERDAMRLLATLR